MLKFNKKIRYYFKYKLLSGCITFFKTTIYGRNAMHWGVTMHTKKYGYICFRLPLICFGRWYPLYLYFSPNATPWASTYYIGKNKEEKINSKIRKKILGHNFKISDYNSEILEIIRNKESELTSLLTKFERKNKLKKLNNKSLQLLC